MSFAIDGSPGGEPPLKDAGLGEEHHGYPVVDESPGPAGDFVACYRDHYQRVVRALELAGASHSRAEDVAQESFARTLGHWHRVRHGSNPPGYVYRTAFRLARRGNPAERSLDAMTGTGLERGQPVVAGDLASEGALRVDLERALETMPAARRRCAVACLVVGLSPNEAGRSLGIAASTVRKQLERARRDLKAALGNT